MDGCQKARACFDANFNCAQSVLAGCEHLTGLNDAAALAVAGAFGGGMRVGSICGAATGALMALGTMFPFTDSARLEDKTRINTLALAFLDAFRQAHGSLNCSDLLGDDRDAALKTLCPELIAWAVRQVETMR